MSKLDVEALKRESRGLRGTIAAELHAPDERFSDEASQLLKFHGVYQQDDRDARKASRDAGGGKAYQMMVRTKNPGGFLPAAFYLGIDALADRFGNGTIRVTTRGGLQLHGVAKDDLQQVIHAIDAALGSTLGACGDINRNVMAPPFPFAAPAYAAARDAARRIADLLTPKTTGYYEIWRDGEVVHSAAPVEEPIYGETFLPRKFKIAVAVPGDNSIDLYTNDLGIVPIVDEAGRVTAYDLTVGGGLGMTHGKKTTYPRLADEFGSVAPERLLEAVRAIVLVQRDYGDRTNRKHARLKYLLDDRGLAWFRSEVERVAGFALAPWRPLPAWTVPSYYGWHEQGDGRSFLGLSILTGRVADRGTVRTKSALRAIVAATACDLVATPDQNLLVVGVAREQRAAVDAILAEHGVDAGAPQAFGADALACPAMPTCGLALAESERSLPALLAQVRDQWRAAGLAENSAPVVRMTGCPNGCARPYMGEIGVVGVSAGLYNLYLGGNRASTRLNLLYRERVRFDEIGDALAPIVARYAAEGGAAEAFGDFCARASVERAAS